MHMKPNLLIISALALLSTVGPQVSTAVAQGTAFTYQGRLNDGGSPATGLYDFRCAIYDAAVNGNAVGNVLTNTATPVANGLFTVTLDFGSVFTGNARWLDLAVRTNGGGAFTTLAPRQALTPTPYAMFTASAFNAATANSAGFANSSPASGLIGTLNLSQLPAGVLTNNATGVTLGGTFSGSGAALTNLNAAQLTGTISSNNIGVGTISGAKLTAGAVGSNQLADGAVTAAKVASLSNWFPLTITDPSRTEGDQFGYSVAAMGTDRVLIGAWRDHTGASDAGAAYLFSSSGVLLTTFTNPTPASNEHFGSSVASVGTDRVLIGASDDRSGAVYVAGAAYLFSTNGVLLTTFANPTPEWGDLFGCSVAAVGTDRVLIGAYQDNTGAPDAGAAYLFSTNGALLTAFTNPTPVGTDYFGWSLAAVGTDKVLIGASGNDIGANNAGAAYLFTTNGALLTTFTNPAPTIAGYFGHPVAAVGTDRVLIGANGNLVGGVSAGAAYLFSTNGALLTTFTNPTPQDEKFGYALAAVGTDRVLIGASTHRTSGTATGAAYLFSTNGTLLATFTNPTPELDDSFGLRVAAVGTSHIVITAPDDDTAGTNAGAVYLFSFETYTPGLVAEGVHAGSVTTDSLADGAVTATKISGELLASQIPELDASTLTSGTLPDTRLSANVALLNANQAFTGPNRFAGAVILTNGDNTIAGNFTGNGAGLTNLNPTNLTGTLPDARLSANVALLNAHQAFAGSNRFAGVLTLTNPANTIAGTFIGNAAGLTNLDATDLTGTIADPRLSANVALLNANQAFSGSNRFAGVLTLTNPANTVAGTFIGNAAGLTNLDATDLTGTIADARLSANVALLNGNQAFSGSNRFAGVLTLTNPANAVAGTFIGNGAALSNLNASQLASGAVPLGLLPGAVVTNNETGLNLGGTFTGNGAGVTNVNLVTINSQGAIGWRTNWGTFLLASSPGVGTHPQAVTAADVNGDGKLDLITANYGAYTLSVLTNNGNGGFVLATSPQVGVGPYSVTAADVNGDGKLDLVSANTVASTLSVLTNNGSGRFVLASSPGVGLNPFSVTAADVNGDGKPDLITANQGGNTLSVLTNSGGGSFVLASSPPVGVNPVFVAAADVNGDGAPDLISANWQDGTLSVLTNNGSGGFVLASLLAVGMGPACVVAVDLNGDGKVDLSSLNWVPNTISVLTNNGSGGFILASSPGVGPHPHSLAAADVNADGSVDLITVSYDNRTFSVLTNNPEHLGSFVLACSPGAGDSPESFAAADVNGDGQVDLISANYNVNTLSVLFNTPDYHADFTGNGSGVTDLDASELTAGTVSLARLPTALLTNTQSGITLTGTFSGNAAGLTNLDATDLTGTIAEARLSTNVALLNTNQVFTASNRFAGVVIMTNTANTLAGTFAGTLTGNGSSLTNLNAANLTGTVADARLSAHVALRNAANTFTATNVFTTKVGIGIASPAQPLHVGDANAYGSQGMIRLASHSGVSAENRTWDIGVPETDSDTSGAGYCFVIDDTQRGTGPEFVVHWGTGNVGIGRLNPATALDVNGTVTATGFSGNAAGLVNQVCSANYLFSYSATTQPVVTANTYQDITTGSDLQINGWTHAVGTASFTNAQAGLYLIQYTAEATTAASASSTVSLRAVLNGFEIMGSQATANANTANLVISISKTFIANISSGAIVKFQLTGSSVNDRLIADTGVGSVRPSFSCTITRLQYAKWNRDT